MPAIGPLRISPDEGFRPSANCRRIRWCIWRRSCRRRPSTWSPVAVEVSVEPAVVPEVARSAMHGGVAPIAAVGRDRSVRQPDLLPPRCVGPPASAGRRLQVRIPPVIVLAPPTIASSVTPPARFAGRIRRLAVLQTLPPFRVEVQHPAPANVPCPNGDGHHGSPPMPEDDGSAHRPGSASQDGAVWPHQAPRKEIAIPVMQPRPGIQTPNRKSAFRESRHDVGAADGTP